ncbi:MAG: hypothetical protein IKE30_09765 [Clostridia bacterium]|nr:hypothetical protein [Clostridia bacterium]
MKKRRFLIRAGVIILLIAIGGCMMVIGRGHTVYFDNKKLEYEGQQLDTYRRINVFVNGEQVAKLSAKERGMASCVGQSFHFDIEATKEKGDDPEQYSFDLSLPYGIDGVIVNLPAIIAGLPQEAWMSEFVPMVVEEEEEEEIVLDDFDMSSDDI